MTNEEKAKILSGTAWGFNCKASKEQYNIAIKMAEWKDEQFDAERQTLIDRACEWIDNLMFAAGYDDYDRSVNINDFRKAMEKKKFYIKN